MTGSDVCRGSVRVGRSTGSSTRARSGACRTTLGNAVGAAGTEAAGRRVGSGRLEPDQVGPAEGPSKAIGGEGALGPAKRTWRWKGASERWWVGGGRCARQKNERKQGKGINLKVKHINKHARATG